MPLIKNIEIANKVQLGVWKINEELDGILSNFAFHKLEKEAYDSISNDSRKKQWLLTRHLLRLISKKNDLWIDHDANRKPIVIGDEIDISITHTTEYVAILLGKNSSLGIDIENIQPRILKIKHKFIREDEFAFLNKENEYLTQLYILWSAKEALFKFYEKGNLDFRKHLQILPFEIEQSGEIYGIISYKQFSQKIKLDYEQINGHILVYTNAS